MKTKLTLIILFSSLLCLNAQEWPWTEDQLSYAREGLSATTLDDSLFFSGGRLYNFTYKNTVDIYDVGENHWESVDLESEDRFYTTSVSCNGKVFIAGGINLLPPIINSNHVDIYDKATGQWTIRYLSEGRHFIGAVANGNKVYFAGGLIFNGSFSYSNVIDVYDTEEGAWMTQLFLSQQKGGVGVASVGSKLVFAGGGVAPNTHTDLVEIYDVNTGEWTYDTLSQARTFPATVAYGNKVYFAGGMLPNSLSSDVVDIYNVDTESWEDTQYLSFPRIARALNVMDALVFVGETDYLSSSGYYGPANGIVDIYYPVTGIWYTLEQNLDPARIMYSCTAYEDKAYIGGGYPGGTSLTDVVSILEHPTVGISSDKSHKLAVQVYPNPFTSNIQVDFNIQHSENVSISIYNSNGKLVENKTNISVQPGDLYVISNIDNLKQGVYFCVIKTENRIHTKKLIKL